jgi:hypothetical protein
MQIDYEILERVLHFISKAIIGGTVLVGIAIRVLVVPETEPLQLVCAVARKKELIRMLVGPENYGGCLFESAVKYASEVVPCDPCGLGIIGSDRIVLLVHPVS